ncbi:hypothetical protein [Clostridium sp.]|uniref:hypothetical protein n=1 Tax=Clostridium sp. TaxID=1506 RepID=UPI001A62EA65|nr:hypothetical protein [Clostridium sp.]MBK5243288.1 hypothetical protein [Clostridium sp.]
MKKSIAMLLITITMSLSFVGCSSASSASKTPTSTETTSAEPIETEPKVEVIKIVLPSGIKDTGKGKIETETPSGNSNEGVVPFIYEDKETQLLQIGFNAWEFDGAKLSYVFVDGVLNCKEQLGDTQTSLNLKEDDLKVGVHKVEVTQYDTDKIDGKVVTYKLGSYEVKAN